MVDVPWPVTNNPGLKPPEGTGRLINVFAEPRSGDDAPVWRRAPGTIVFSRAPSSGTIQLEFSANARGQTMFSSFFELVGSTTLQLATSGETTLDFPSNTLAGDLVFYAHVSDGVANPTTPTGWANIGTSVANLGTALHWKVSTGEMSVVSVNPNGAAGNGAAYLVWAIRGADQANPLVDTPTQSTGASGDPVPPNITATTANCLLMNVSYIDDDVATLTTAAVAPTTITIGGVSTWGMGYQIGAQTTGGAADCANIVVAFRPLATTGAITASTWTLNSDDEWVSRNVTIRHA